MKMPLVPAAAVGALALALSAAPAHAAPTTALAGAGASHSHGRVHLTDGTAYVKAHGRHTRSTARSGASQLAAAGLPTFTKTFTDANTGSSYTDSFVGTDPAEGGSSTVDVHIVPMNFVLENSDGTSTTVDASSTAATAAQSPLFVDGAQAPTGENTQYYDAYVRANWNVTNSDYHVKLNPVVEQPVTIDVPAGNWSDYGGTIGVNAQTIENAVSSHGSSYGGDGLAMFVGDNVMGDEGGGSGFGGYHTYENGVTDGYTMVDQDGHGLQAFSHEVSEWGMDPTVDNAIPNASVEGYGCLNNLEVGDPVYTSTYSQTDNAGQAWTLEDEVFTDWFFHTTPPNTSNGAYSLQGVNTPASTC